MSRATTTEDIAVFAAVISSMATAMATIVGYQTGVLEITGLGAFETFIIGIVVAVLYGMALGAILIEG